MALALIAGYLFTTMLCYYLFRSNDFDFFAVFWFLGTIAIYIAYYYRMTIKIEGNFADVQNNERSEDAHAVALPK